MVFPSNDFFQGIRTFIIVHVGLMTSTSSHFDSTNPGKTILISPHRLAWGLHLDSKTKLAARLACWCCVRLRLVCPCKSSSALFCSSLYGVWHCVERLMIKIGWYTFLKATASKQSSQRARYLALLFRSTICPSFWSLEQTIKWAHSNYGRSLKPD